MDYVTERTPEECLTAAETLFVRSWPYRGVFVRAGHAVKFTEHSGCLGLLLHGGTHGVQVFASPERDGSRITVSATRNKYVEPVDAFLRKELDAEPA